MEADCTKQDNSPSDRVPAASASILLGIQGEGRERIRNDLGHSAHCYSAQTNSYEYRALGQMVGWVSNLLGLGISGARRDATGSRYGHAYAIVFTRQ